MLAAVVVARSFNRVKNSSKVVINHAFVWPGTIIVNLATVFHFLLFLKVKRCNRQKLIGSLEIGFHNRQTLPQGKTITCSVAVMNGM